MTRIDTGVALDALLHPSSVAVIGASDSADNLISSAPIVNLRRFGFDGRIFPVNPRRQEVGGLPCFPSVAALPEPVDSAVIVAPHSRVGSLVEECDAAGVLVATIATGGVDVTALRTAERRIRLLGPESLGVTNLHDRYVPRAALNQRMPEDTTCGGIVIVTQSGATSNILFNLAQSAGAGVAYSLNTGREADLGVWDVVGHLVDDPRVRVFMVVVEGFGDPPGFLQAAGRARTAGKPIVLLELGRSAAGADAVLSHSGAIAGSPAVHAEVCRRMGVIVADDFGELWRTAALFEHWGVRAAPRSSRSLGVLAMSGGEGALIADLAEAHRVPLGAVGPQLAAAIGERFPECSASNPFDPSTRLLSDEQRTNELVELILGSGFTELLLAAPVYSPEFADRRLRPLVSAVRGHHESVVMSSWSAPPVTDRQRALIRRAGVPSVGDSAETLAALANHVWYGDALVDPERDIVPTEQLVATTATGGADTTIDYSAARRAIEAAGIAVAAARRIALPADDDAVAEVCRQLRAPYVVKGDVDSTTHKAELGLVLLGLADAAAVGEAIRRLRARVPDLPGVTVEEQLVADWEVFLGGRVDPEFGPTLIVGSGGGAAEALGDSALAVGLLDGSDAERLLRRTAIGSFLVRREPRAATAVGKALVALSRWLVVHRADVHSIDVNPLLLWRDGRTCAVDARIEVAV